MKQTVEDELAILAAKFSNGEITDSEFQAVESMILNRVDGPPPKVSRKTLWIFWAIIVVSGIVTLWYFGVTLQDVRDFVRRLWVALGIAAAFCFFLLFLGSFR